MRERIRATIEAIVDEELEAALGAGRSARGGLGSRGLSAREAGANVEYEPGSDDDCDAAGWLEDADGKSREWRNRRLPRYQRRTERVNEAILGIYPSGTNTRRLRGALSPLLGGAPLSKDAVSRLVGRLREGLEAWAKRDLSELRVRYIFLDG